MSEPTPIQDILSRLNDPIPDNDFQRHPTSSAPYVDHPVDVTAAGKPRRVLYGRPSSMFKQIENTTNLSKWSERQVARGVAILVADGLDVADYANLDPEVSEDRTRLDGLVVDAQTAAKAYVAAERGTHGHLITEDIDTDRDPIARLEAGESLGLPAWIQVALVRAWLMLCKTFGLEILAVEERCVCDRWRVAGSLDRVARLTTPLKFGRITIPAGTVLILDIKTGRLRLEQGHPLYWHGYTCQVAAYANSQRYVIEHVKGQRVERRAEWDWGVSTQHALIGHLDIRDALETGVLVARMFYVDLLAGAQAADLAVSAKEFEKRRDLFELYGSEVAVSIGDVVDDTPAVAEQMLRQADMLAFEAEQMDDMDTLVRHWIAQRVTVLGGFSEYAKRNVIKFWPPEAAKPLSLDPAHFDAVVAVLDAIERHYEVPFGPSDPRLPRHGHRSQTNTEEQP